MVNVSLAWCVSTAHQKHCIAGLHYWLNLGGSWEEDAFVLTSICSVNIELLLWASLWHKYPELSSLTLHVNNKANCANPAFIANCWHWMEPVHVCDSRPNCLGRLRQECEYCAQMCRYVIWRTVMQKYFQMWAYNSSLCQFFYSVL